MCLCFFSSCHKNTVNPKPLAEKGFLDLSAWEAEKDGIVELNGEWEFYWKQLLEPEDFSISRIIAPELINVPKPWKGYALNGQELGPYGFATFRLRIKIPGSGGMYGLYCNNIETAYRIWINGDLKAEVGKVGRDYKTAVPQYLHSVSYFTVEENMVEIIIQASNFRHFRGGIRDPIDFGTTEQASDERQDLRTKNLLISGIFLITAIYHLILYAYRRVDLSLLYFGLFGLSLSAYMLFLFEKLHIQTFPDLNWEIHIKIIYYSFLFGTVLYLTFLYQLFPKETSKNFVRFIWCGFSFIGLIILFTRASIHMRTIPVSYVLIVISIGYSMIVLIKAVRKRRDGAIIQLMPCLIFLATAINDTLYSSGIIRTGRLVPISILTFVLWQFVFLARRSARSFSDSEALSRKLKHKADELGQSLSISESLSHELEDKAEELRKTNAELLKLNKMNDDFLANCSHELRTPLAGIIGIGESVIDGISGRLPNGAKNQLDILVKSAKRLSNIVNEILDFSKLKDQNIILQKKPVDMRQVVEVVLWLVRPLLRGKPVELINDIQEDSPYVDGDEERLQQIMYNLIGNAVKFTESGWVRIAGEIKGNYMEMSVMDTGIGIPVEKLTDIFKSFEQADSSISQKYGGTGLGLFITKKLVELHGGGTIDVKSEMGKGSIFTFALALSKEKVPAALEAISQPKQYPLEERTKKDGTLQFIHRGGDFHILIVEDEMIAQQVLINHLSTQNYSLSVCQDGLKALEFIRGKGKPDLILLDIMLPRMNGFEVCRKIREMYPRKELPVILVSAKGRGIDITEGFNAGANDYIVKPFLKEDLFIRIRYHLDLYDAHQKLKPEKEFEAEIGKVLANLNRTLYIKADQSICNLYFGNPKLGALPIELPIGKVSDYFKNRNSMIRVHRSYLVNPEKIRRIIRHGSVYKISFDQSEKQIPIGRMHVKRIRAAYPNLFKK